MSEIDTSEWKQFVLTDLFEMNNTKSITQKAITPDSGDTPYVTARTGNNGVLTYITCPDEWTEPAPCILIGGKTLALSYQVNNFCSNDSHNIALYSKDSNAKSENCQLFLITVLRATMAARYSWGDSISMTRIVDESISLPVSTDGKPDWAWMDQYISAVTGVATARMAALIGHLE